jgi:hypothetical protein
MNKLCKNIINNINNKFYTDDSIDQLSAPFR